MSVIEVVVISFDDFFIAIETYLLTRLVGFQNLLDMSIRHDILVFPLIKLLRSIDKVNITIGTVLLMMTVVGILVLKKILAGRPITVSIAPSF